MLRRSASLVAMLAIGTTALAQGHKPPVPAGLDPGGVAVALLGSGVDYTVPQVGRGLARDGEGEPIGFDAIDNDNRPFGDRNARTPPALGGDGTTVALDLLDPAAGVRLVPVRADPRKPASLARAVAFIARTPARIVVVPMWSPSKEDWQQFGQAAERSPQLLFVVAAGDDGRDLDLEPAYPAALGLPNVLVVTAAQTVAASPLSARIREGASWGAKTVDAVAVAAGSALAASVAAKAAAMLLAQAPQPGGADLKRRLIQLSTLQREGETPQRTRTLSILVPSLPGPTRNPRDRILDKSRIPERMQDPNRRDQRPQDGKTK